MHMASEHGVFTPLVLSSSDGMGGEAQTFYKHLICTCKRDVPYSSLKGWLRFKLSLDLRSCVSEEADPRYQGHIGSIVLACSEGCVPQEF